MASSSTTSLLRSFKYDVFLSFRGEDIRKTFIDHLYAALKHQGINTFKDDKKLKKGERIDNQLIKSIEDSKFFIVVFSQNYASSSWCLDELVKIIECHKNNKQTAYPVFYDVDPSEVRKQRETYGEALSRHNNKEDVEKWRDALKEAGNLAGCDVRKTADGHEAEVIKQIVADISNRLCSSYLSKDEKLVGMEVRMPPLLSNLDINTNDVHMIGIKGMGGAGKTTLARAVFERISSHYDGVSFVDNVREISKDTVSGGLQSLQKKILSDVLKEQQITVSSSVEGKRMMENRLCGIKALVVLDDVDDVSQLEALAGSPDWFKAGSRIIITTRDEQVLVAHGVKIKHDINLLSKEEAICLFSRYAFKGDIPNKGYVKHSHQVVHYAAGLPLTVKVLGSLLCGQDKTVWIDVLKRLKRIPLKKIMDVLELIYMSLEDEHKEIFLDLACFLKNWSKDEAIRVLESCGFHATFGLTVLQQKSLITFSQYRDSIEMHDLIEDMGKNVVRRDHPDDPSRHSRLWIKQEVEDVMVNDLGTEATRFIEMRTDLGAEIIMKGLGNMKKLRVVRVSDDKSLHELLNPFSLKFDEACQYFTNALRYLNWQAYPWCSLPKSFQANNLVVLEMPCSNIEQLWKDGERKALDNLKFLDLSWSNLTKIDLVLTPNLEVLKLENCNQLLDLDMSVGCQKLRSLNLNHSVLMKLDLQLTLTLEMLELGNCHKLVELDMPIGFVQLRSLRLRLSYFISLDVGLISNLEKLSLYQGRSDLSVPQIRIACEKLRVLEIHNVRSRTLDLTQCPNLTHFDMLFSNFITLDFRQCHNLTDCKIAGSQLINLDLRQCPNLTGCSITLSNIKTLDLRLNPKLKYLDLDNSNDLEELHIKCPELNSCEITRAKLKTLDLGLTPKLRNLKLANCHDLEEPHMNFGCLKELRHLNLVGSSGIKTIVLTKECEFCPSVESLDVCPLDSNHGLPNIWLSCLNKEQPSSSARSENLEKLIVGSCCCSYLRNVLETIACLPSSTNLTLGCSIPKIPIENGALEHPEELIFSCTEITYLPYINLENSQYLTRLKSLKLELCTSLKAFPRDTIGLLECLEKLHLTYAPIECLPNDICRLKCLKSLQLVCCQFLEKLPEDLGQLECLEELILQGCKLLHDIPYSICEMKCLKRLHLPYCTAIEKLPDEVGHVESLLELNIVGTCIRHLPKSIFSLKDLRIVRYQWHLEMSGFTFANVELISAIPKGGNSQYIRHNS